MSVTLPRTTSIMSDSYFKKVKLSIEGRKTATIEDAKYFLEMLWFAEDRDTTIQKLRKIPNFKEEWLEFIN